VRPTAPLPHSRRGSPSERPGSFVPHAVAVAAGAVAHAGDDPLALPTKIAAGVVILFVLILLGLAMFRRLLAARVSP
jgi:hypothetical protein